MVEFNQKRALVVDDFAQMRITLRHMLESFQIPQVDVATNGRGALEQLAAQSYDIVVCDFNLGEGPDGQQVLEEAKYRGLLRYSSIFIIITAEATVDVVMGVIEHKPDDYLMKPFNKDLLRSRLEKLIARKSDFEAVEREMQRGDLSRAIALCDERIQQAPRNLTEFLKLKGELCLDAGRDEDAERVYKQVLATRRVPWALMGLGRVHFVRKEYAEAMRLFRDVIGKNKAHVEAYDWLARTLEELGQPEKAQEVLTAGVTISPHALRRQKALGTLAFKNKAFDVAEKAFRQTISLGKYSVYRSASHYADLAHCLVHKDSGQEAINTLNAMRSEFKRDQDAILQATIMEGVVFKKMGREEDAEKSFAQAKVLFEETDGRASTEATLSMGRAHFMFNDTKAGGELLDRVVRNNHENERVLRDAQDIFDQVGLGKEGRKRISQVTGEVTQLNNRGVDLVREGKLDEAIRLFEEAVATMSGNQTLNLNAAQAILMYMKQNVVSQEYLAKVHQYLQQAGEINPDNPTFKKLRAVFQTMAKTALEGKKA